MLAASIALLFQGVTSELTWAYVRESDALCGDKTCGEDSFCSSTGCRLYKDEGEPCGTDEDRCKSGFSCDVSGFLPVGICRVVETVSNEVALFRQQGNQCGSNNGLTCGIGYTCVDGFCINANQGADCRNYAAACSICAQNNACAWAPIERTCVSVNACQTVGYCLANSLECNSMPADPCNLITQQGCTVCANENECSFDYSRNMCVLNNLCNSNTCIRSSNNCPAQVGCTRISDCTQCKGTNGCSYDPMQGRCAECPAQLCTSNPQQCNLPIVQTQACVAYSSCSSCSNAGCVWVGQAFCSATCTSNQGCVYSAGSCNAGAATRCSSKLYCGDCQRQGCYWNNINGKRFCSTQCESTYCVTPYQEGGYGGGGNQQRTAQCPAGTGGGTIPCTQFNPGCPNNMRCDFNLQACTSQNGGNGGNIQTQFCGNGNPCSGGQTCNFQTGYCTNNGGNTNGGSYCNQNNNYYCQQGYCRQGICTSYNNNNVNNGGVGSFCSQSNQNCQQGLTCNTQTQQCVANNGGNTNGGSYCNQNNNYYCQQGSCRQGICTSSNNNNNGGIGSFCSQFNQNCQQGLYCNTQMQQCVGYV